MKTGRWAAAMALASGFAALQASAGDPSAGMTLAARKIRDLGLATPSSTGRPFHLAAASGLVGAGGKLYVAADDELHLGVFAAGDPLAAGSLFRIFPGDLPVDPKLRKKTKPDLEALVFLSDRFFPDAGAILAIPSGSRANQVTGVLVSVNPAGEIAGSPRPVGFTLLYAELGRRFPKLNIEGAALHGGELLLLQRGKGLAGDNAVIRMDAAGLADDVRADRPIQPGRILGVQVCDLGELDGVRLSFTDASPSGDGRVFFLAAAEDKRPNPPHGPFAGSVLGLLVPGACPSRMLTLSPRMKAEGLHVRAGAPGAEALIVTDADDPNQPAALFSASLAGFTP